MRRMDIPRPMKKALVVGGLVIFCIVGFRHCRPKDENPLPSPHADMSLMAYAVFGSSGGNAGTFPSRFYVVDEKGQNQYPWYSLGFFSGRHVARTLQGARTLVVVNSSTREVGKWVSPVLGQEQGTASTSSVTVVFVEIQNPLHRCAVSGYSYPGRTTKEGTTVIDGETIQNSQYAAASMADMLIEKVATKGCGPKVK